MAQKGLEHAGLCLADPQRVSSPGHRFGSGAALEVSNLICFLMPDLQSYYGSRTMKQAEVLQG